MFKTGLNIVYIILILGTTLFTINSCEKPKTYSDIPEIEFMDIEIRNDFDTLDNPVYRTTVHFSFVDGDGDLGLDAGDTLGSFANGGENYYNLIFNFYEKVNGEDILNENIKPYFRFKNISKVNTTNKVLKGEMKVEVDFSTMLSYADTCYMDFHIIDRALNKSNIEKTSEIYFNE